MLKRAIELWCEARDLHVKYGATEVNLWRGQRELARGTVVQQAGMYDTDVDLYIDAEGRVIVHGDENSTGRIAREIQACYEAAVREWALQELRMGVKMKAVMKNNKVQVIGQAVGA